jgi:hypothetical protein
MEHHQKTNKHWVSKEFFVVAKGYVDKLVESRTIPSQTILNVSSNGSGSLVRVRSEGPVFVLPVEEKRVAYAENRM